MMNFKCTILDESGLSRIWQYTQDDKYTFAVIGARDKDTDFSHIFELKKLIMEAKKNNPNITCKDLEGLYTYENGDSYTEPSIMINNIDKETALTIARKINQETIIWKDANFFGLLDCETGSPALTFSREPRNLNLNPNQLLDANSKLINTRHKSDSDEKRRFKFEAYEVIVQSPKDKSPSHSFGYLNKVIKNPLYSITEDMREDILLEDDSDMGLFSQWYTFLTPEELSDLYDTKEEWDKDVEIFKKAIKSSYGDTATYVGTIVCKPEYADKLIEAGYEFMDIISTPDGNIPIQETDDGQCIVITVDDINVALNGEWYDKPETPIEEQVHIYTKAPGDHEDEEERETHSFETKEQAKKWIKDFGIKKSDVYNYQNISDEEMDEVLTENMKNNNKLEERVFNLGCNGGKKKMFGKFAIYDNDGDGDIDMDDLRDFFMNNPELTGASGVPSYSANPTAYMDAIKPFEGNLEISENLTEDDAEDRRAEARQKRLDAKTRKSTALVAKVKAILADGENEEASNVLEALFNETVPPSGKASTVGGEIIRAAMRIMYRNFNDGDYPFIGYGIETCGGSLCYIIDMCTDTSCDFFAEAERCAESIDPEYDWDDYVNNDFSDMILKAIQELGVDKVFSTPNTVDSRNYDYSMMDDIEPVYEGEYEYPEELKWHIEKGHVSPSDILDDIESNDYTYGDGTYEAFDDYISAKYVPYEVYQDLESNLNDLFDAWVDNLNDEYGSMYDDDDDEPVDEGLLDTIGQAGANIANKATSALGALNPLAGIMNNN